MTKEATRDYLQRAEALLDKLPDGAEMISLTPGDRVQLQGEFDFRKFAESNGSHVESHLRDGYIHMYARLFGLYLVNVISSEDKLYRRELDKCPNL